MAKKKLKKVAIYIETCEECNELKDGRDYTGDSFEYCERWQCRKKNNKDIVRYLGVFETKPPVPDWCPKRRIRKVKDKK